MASKADSVALYRIRRILSELSTKRGRGTELISLYIPPKKPPHEVASALREEYGTASNIKSDVTRNHVQDALVKTMQRLKLYHRTPDNGLVIFCGVLPTDGPGSEVIELHEIFPHKPIQTYLYRCDDHFHLDQLRDMIKEERIVGVISVDTTEAGLGIITGDRTEVVEVIKSGVGGKHRAGGQSARRFERLREAGINEYFQRVARHSAKVFLEQHSVEGLIVSGPGPTKDSFLKGGYLDYRLQEAVLAVIDASYAGREGVREALMKAQSVLQDLRIVEERGFIEKFLKEVSSGSGLALYGINETIDALRRGNARTILVSDDVNLAFIQVICKKCGHTTEKIVKREELITEKQRLLTEPCPSCQGSEIKWVEKDFIDFLADIALERGARVEVISSKGEEGTMFKSFGGVAALLDYR